MADGVLGGANDAEFGGRRRFGHVTNPTSTADDDDKKGRKSGDKQGGSGTTTGFEAGAMEEGFYQRDVVAEYEALDYDANEQFDDDDVNLGEDEIMNEGGGYADAAGDDYFYSGEEFDSDEDWDDFNDDEDGREYGMASSSGLKAMIAKARGNLPSKAE